MRVGGGEMRVVVVTSAATSSGAVVRTFVNGVVVVPSGRGTSESKSIK